MTRTSLRQFADEIAAALHHVHRIIICGPGVEHTEAIMMLGCEHNRAHTGILGKLSDLIGIEVHRLEFIGGLGIPVRKYSCKRLDLFAISLTYRFTVPYSSKMGIKSEVDEHGIFV